MAALSPFTLASPAAARTETLPAPSLWRPLRGGVVRVQAQSATNRNAGSGVVIAPEQVVTNCHVTTGARSISIGHDGKWFAADGQWAAPELDVCVLRVSGLPASAVPLAPRASVYIGDAVAALGFSGGATLHVNVGRVRGLHRQAGAHALESSAGFSSGASGGGLFDVKGQLLGVLTFRSRGPHARFYAAPIDWLPQLPLAADAFKPLDGFGAMPLAYWQLPLSEQPAHLQMQELAEQGRWPRVASLADAWIVRDVTDAEPLLWRSRAWLQAGHEREACADVRRALEAQPDSAAGWLAWNDWAHAAADGVAANASQRAVTKLMPAIADPPLARSDASQYVNLPLPQSAGHVLQPCR